MAEAAPLVVGIDTLADATVSSDVGEEERSASGPRALSCQLVIESVIYIVMNSRPLGQGCSPARPGEDRARPSVCPVRTVSKMDVVGGHSLPQHGSRLTHLEAWSRLETYSQLGGKM